MLLLDLMSGGETKMTGVRGRELAQMKGRDGARAPVLRMVSGGELTGREVIVDGG